jgi:hypothetical protein
MVPDVRSSRASSPRTHDETQSAQRARGPRYRGILAAWLAAGLLCVIGAQVGGVQIGAAAAPVYTVAQTRALLLSHPAAVLGRTVLVRGIIEGPFVFCAETRPCPPATLGLINAENESIGPGQYLPIETRPAVGQMAFLRRIPPLRPLLPAPQHLQFGFTATYRLELRAAPSLCSRNRAILCYEGVIMDAAPA